MKELDLNPQRDQMATARECGENKDVDSVDGIIKATLLRSGLPMTFLDYICDDN